MSALVRQWVCTRIVDGKPCGNTGSQGPRGPLRNTCDACRARAGRDLKRQNRHAAALALQAEQGLVVPPPRLVSENGEPLETATQAVRVSLLEGVEEFLASVEMTAGGAGLRAVARRLAEAGDSPASASDLRLLTAICRELRTTLLAMAPERGSEADELTGLRPTLVDASTG